MHYHNIILFFEPALVLVDLAFERFDREIDRLLETFAPAPVSYTHLTLPTTE